MTDLFDKFKDNAEVTPFNNEKYYGLSIHWGLKGVGFGELVFAVNKETGELSLDRECMSDETCGKIMDVLKKNGQLVSEHGYYDAGPGLSLPVTAKAVTTKREYYYSCGCRIVGGVGDPGCDDCTEPGLR
jgi:hypothetical protein